MPTDWSDLNRDGRRMETIIRLCFNHMKSENDFDRKMGYLDRVIKATNQKVQIVEIVLGVKEVLRQKKIGQIIVTT